MLDSTESQADRLARRRARRWQRRARIAGPFLVVPVMLGLLVLSVDLIEYQPAEPTGSAKNRPRAASAPRPGPEREAMLQAPDAALAVSVVDAPMPGAMERAEAAPRRPGLPAWLGDSTDVESR
jgi:hypothetical protein